MPGDLTPLFSQNQLIKPDGTPTDFFIRWAQQKQIDIGDSITAEQAQQLINDWAAARHINTTAPITGGGPLSGDLTLGHDVSGVTAATYGDATHVPKITVDVDGHVTNVVAVAISGGGGGGAFVKIAQTVLAAVANSVTFAAIPGTYTDLVLVTKAGNDATNTAPHMRLQFNGDVGANYDYFYWNRYGVTGPNFARTFIDLGELPPVKTGGTAQGVHGLTLDIYSYANADINKQLSGTSGFRYPISGGFGVDAFTESYSATWNNAAGDPITSILLTPAANNFSVGSTFTLYGRG